MRSLSKKLQRKKEKEAQKELKKKVGLFNKLSDECFACQKPFDKKNREMVNTWSVVVQQSQQEVRLYCPECWEFAKQLIMEAKDGYINAKNNV